MLFLSLNKSKLAPVFVAVIVNIIGISAMARTSLMVKRPPLIQYEATKSIPKPTIAERKTNGGIELFYILNGELIRQFKGEKEVVLYDSRLKGVYLYKNKYIVVYTHTQPISDRNGFVYILLPDEEGNEFHFAGGKTKVWHWQMTIDYVMDFAIDGQDMVAIYAGQWGVFSTPTIVYFSAIDEQIIKRKRESMTISCGMGCTRAPLGQPMHEYQYNKKYRRIWSNTEIVDFESIGYDAQGRVAVKFNDYPAALPIKLIKDNPDAFKTISEGLASN